MESRNNEKYRVETFDGKNFDSVMSSIEYRLEALDDDYEMKIRNIEKIHATFELSVRRAELLKVERPEEDYEVKTLMATPAQYPLKIQLRDARRDIYEVLSRAIPAKQWVTFPASANFMKDRFVKIPTVWMYIKTRYGKSSKQEALSTLRALVPQMSVRYDNASKLSEFVITQGERIRVELQKATGLQLERLPDWFPVLVIISNLPDEESKHIPLDSKVGDLLSFVEFIKGKLQNNFTWRKRGADSGIHNVESKLKACFYCGSTKHVLYKKKDGARVYLCPQKIADLAKGLDRKNNKIKAKDVVNNVEVEVNTTSTKDTDVPFLEVSNFKTKRFKRELSFVIDSGAGVNLTGAKLRPYKISKEIINLHFPNNSTQSVNKVVDVLLTVRTTLGKLIQVRIDNVLLSDHSESNILSEFELIQSGIPIKNSGCGQYKELLINDEDTVRAYQNRGVYRLEVEEINSVSNEINKIITSTYETPEKRAEQVAKYLHLVFGHIGHARIIRMYEDEAIVGLPQVNLQLLKKVEFTCANCASAKQLRMSYKQLVGRRATEPLHTVHTDTLEFEVCGRIEGKRSVRFSLNFIDDCTSYKWTYYLSAKKQTQEVLKEWVTMVEHQYGYKVKIIRTDGGKAEYFNPTVRNFCKERGILHQSANPYSQSENGAAERHNGVSTAATRAMILSVGFPDHLWPEAHRHSVYLDNITPKQRLGWKTPFEALTGQKPTVDLKKLPLFGAVVTAFIPIEKRRSKALANRSNKCRFLGLEDQYKSYRVWDLDNNLITKCRSIQLSSQYVKEVFEATFRSNATLSTEEVCRMVAPRKSQAERVEERAPDDTIELAGASSERTPGETSSLLPEGLLVVEELEEKPALEERDKEKDEEDEFELNPIESSEKSDDVTELDLDGSSGTRSTSIESRPRRVRCKPRRFDDDYVAFIQHIEEERSRKLHIRVPEPRTLSEAFESEYGEEWRKAFKVEVDALKANQTWELVELPENRKAIKSKWVFKVKYKPSGDIDKFKCRLCVVGCMQKSGLDYTEVFSPVCRLESLRVFLALGAALDMHIHQLDISTAFLHADVDEDVYMMQPEGTVEQGKERLVCKLVKALYGLRQSPRLFNKLLHEYLTSLGFKRLSKEYCFYKLVESGGRVILVAVYVDDLSLACNCLVWLDRIKQQLSIRFNITDGGELSYILQMEVHRDRGQRILYLSQRKYISDICKEYCPKVVENRVPKTPMVPGKFLIEGPVLTKQQEQELGIKYRHLVGALAHVQRGTRPDIANAVRELSRCLNCYNQEHFKAALRVVNYLKQSNALCLCFQGNMNMKDIDFFHVYADASFGDKALKRKSVTGFVVMFAGAAVAYKSVVQRCISVSTLQAEIVACSEACREAEWIRMLLEEMGFKFSNPTPVYCDNEGVVKTVKNPANHNGCKHIEVRHLYARELNELNKINIQYVSTVDMVADIFTKNLSESQFCYLRDKLGLKELPGEFQHKLNY